MKQSLKTCLPLGEGGCEQSEQTEGRGTKLSPPLVAYGDSSPKGEPRINANGSVLTVNNKLSY